MRFYADLHIHSRFSRACSKKLTLSEIYRWCQYKGIKLIGTADFTHPEWRKEIQDQLEEAEEGLFRLKKPYADEIDRTLPASCKSEVRFMLSVEISLIYKRDDKVRKIHHVILMPDISSVDLLVSELEKIGNLKSDGRPILGLDSRDLLDIVMSVNEKALFIPGHIWTPWFSLFGDKSGFDSLEECFGDKKKYIYAIETGLSSDPKMNWMISELDDLAIVSNSDAHSADKIAREATIFNCELNYGEIRNAIIHNDERLEGTIEFFPEEGKYHYDGHRACDIQLDPKETEKLDAICPKCKKRLTVGVLNRVCKLASKNSDRKNKNAKQYFSVIPFKEVLSEILGKGVQTKTVAEEFSKVVSKFGNELSIALDVPIRELATHSSLLAEAIKRMREGNIHILPGYDGVFGEITIFDDKEKETLDKQDQITLV